MKNILSLCLSRVVERFPANIKKKFNIASITSKLWEKLLNFLLNEAWRNYVILLKHSNINNNCEIK